MNKQVSMITDDKPRIVNKALEEAAYCGEERA